MSEEVPAAPFQCAMDRSFTKNRLGWNAAVDKPVQSKGGSGAHHSQTSEMDLRKLQKPRNKRNRLNVFPKYNRILNLHGINSLKTVLNCIKLSYDPVQTVLQTGTLADVANEARPT